MHLTRQSINQFTCAHQFRFNRCGRVGKNPALCLPCASFRCNAGWCSIFITPTWPALKQQNCDSIFQSPGVKSPFISRPVIKVVFTMPPGYRMHSAQARILKEENTYISANAVYLDKMIEIRSSQQLCTTSLSNSLQAVVIKPSILHKLWHRYLDLGLDGLQPSGYHYIED